MRRFFWLSLFFLFSPALLSAQETSAARTQTWVYVEDFEVRHELLFPLQELELLIPISRANPDTVTVSEQEAAKELVLTLVQSASELDVDGHHAKETTAEVIFLDKEITTITDFPAPKDMPTSGTLVGVIRRFQRETPVEQVDLEWSLYTDLFNSMACTLYFKAKEEKAILSETSPSIRWRREIPRVAQSMIPVPEPQWLSGFLGEKLTLDTEEAPIITGALLKNIYAAFEFRSESAIYDALAESVTGRALQEVYLEFRQQLQTQAEGGPNSIIDAVEVLASSLKTPLKEQRFQQTITWTAAGRVEHWGHLHRRMNRYDAVFTVDASKERWQISRIVIAEQQRVEATTIRRKNEEEVSN